MFAISSAMYQGRGSRWEVVVVLLGVCEMSIKVNINFNIRGSRSEAK